LAIDLSFITNSIKAIKIKLITFSFILICIFLAPIIVLELLGDILHFSNNPDKTSESISYVSILMLILKSGLFLVAGFNFTRLAVPLRIFNLVLFSALMPLVVRLEIILRSEVIKYLYSHPNILTQFTKNNTSYHDTYITNALVDVTVLYLGIFILGALAAIFSVRNKK